MACVVRTAGDLLEARRGVSREHLDRLRPARRRLGLDRRGIVGIEHRDAVTTDGDRNGQSRAMRRQAGERRRRLRGRRHGADRC